ncbi:MAG: hypothetical protein AAB890_00365 [Patescibacteria group bacterium]
MKLVDFKKIISYFNSHSVHSLEINARRDWKVIMISFLFVLAVMLLVDGYFFWKFSGVLEENIAPEDKKVAAINRALLDEVLEKIMEREKRFKESFQNVKITNPSL